MQTADRLSEILDALHDPARREAALADAEAFVRSLPAEEFLAAEEELAARGVPRERIRALCPAHINAQGDERDRFRASLPDAHPLALLMDEHVQILRLLDRLEALAADASDPAAAQEMASIGDALSGCEPHHEREERALFPALVERGIGGPPAVMEAEHVELRSLKRAVAERGRRVAAGEPDAAVPLRDAATRLVGVLRDHVFKEDNVLYPMCLRAIAPERWTEIARRCDEIGACADLPVG